MEQFPLPNEFEVRQPLKVPSGAKAGKLEVGGALDYQICDATSCLPPDEATFTAALTIDAPAAAASAGAGTVTQEPKPAPRTETKPGLKIETDPAKVAIAAKFDPTTARAGEVSTLVLKVTVLDKGFHAYGTLEPTNAPVKLDPEKVDAGVLERTGNAVVPPGKLKMKGSLPTYPLPHEFEVRQAFRVPSGTKPSTIDVSGALDYQLCTETYCLGADVIDFEAMLVVEAGEARADASKPPAPAPAPTPTSPKAGDDAGNSVGGSWWLLILSCIGGGVFALVMPCTYPMIPITFSFFTKQAEKRGGHVLPLALTYALGIVGMFAGLGMLVAFATETVSDQDIIEFANNPVLNSVIGVAFLVFAFSLFGWINLQPPQFLTRAAGKASASGGYIGVLFMGATLVITSFTCTAPIVGALLASVVSQGPGRVIVGMAVVGLTMAVPFLLLALAPTKVKALPRSGEWMEVVKVSLGFVELAATLKFVSLVDVALDWQLLPRELFLLLCAAIFVLWALYLFGILRKTGTANEGVGGGRMATGMFVTLVATYFLFGGLGNRLDFYMTAFAPPYSATTVGARAGGANATKASTHVIVKDDGDRALELAKAEGKLLLYNFTGFN
jgi:thiol:disulfide interchange protein